MANRFTKAFNILTKGSDDTERSWNIVADWLKAQATGSVGLLSWQDQVNKFNRTTYACVNKIANAVAAVPLKLYAMKRSENEKLNARTTSIDEKDFKYLISLPYMRKILDKYKAIELVCVEEHPALDMMNRVNAKMTQFDLTYLTVAYLLLTGNCYWKFDKPESPTLAWILMPQYVKIEQNELAEVTRYIYKPGSKEVVIDPDLIIHFWIPGPFSQVYGYSPVVAASNGISLEENIYKYQQAMFENMGVPESLVILKSRMSEEQFKRFKADWESKYSGVSKAWKLGFLEGDMDLKKVGATPTEMGFMEGEKLARELIANIFGVPLSKLTMESSNRAVAEQGELAFQRDTIVPICTRVAMELTESLASKYGSGYIFAFDNPVPEDRRLDIEERQANLSTGFSTINEERQSAGKEPVDGGDVLLIPTGVMPMPVGGEEQEKQFVDLVVRVLLEAKKELENLL